MRECQRQKISSYEREKTASEQKALLRAEKVIMREIVTSSEGGNGAKKRAGLIALWTKAHPSHTYTHTHMRRILFAANVIISNRFAIKQFVLEANVEGGFNAQIGCQAREAAH